MRILIVALVGASALAAQATEPDASAKLKQFERNLQNTLRPRGVLVRLHLASPAVRPCAVPLLKVGPDASFQSNMPRVAPDPEVKFSAREVVPRAPSCGEPENK